MTTTEKLQNLINIAIDLIPQLQEFLVSEKIETEVKEFVAKNIIILDQMTKVAIYFNGDEETTKKFIEVYSSSLEENYNFAKKFFE
ncbi:hypothetical protein GW796_08680 [archaeon]|nr:hypothetical protein [archaeon]NCQ51953.1 hypothetical protein [archaeon]